jgi:hypothetical protein
MRSLLLSLLMGVATGLRPTILCMVSAPRPGNASYLDRTVLALHKQGVHIRDDVGLMIVHVDSQKGVGVLLKNRTLVQCRPPVGENLPSCVVQQSGYDVAASLLLCAQRASAWVVLLEDDCEVCEGGLDEMLDSIGRLDPRLMSMAKYSKFSRAWAFPVHKVTAFAASVVRRIKTHPYDVTRVEEWDTQRERVQFYHHPVNLFHHIGSISTDPVRNTPEYNAMYHTLRRDTCRELLVS